MSHAGCQALWPLATDTPHLPRITNLGCSGQKLWQKVGDGSRQPCCGQRVPEKTGGVGDWG